MRPPGRRALDAYERLLRLYPRAFRERFGASMLSAFEAEHEAVRGQGPIRGAMFWCRTVWATIVSALLEHVRALRGGGPNRRGPSRFGTDALAELRMALRAVSRSPRTSLAVVLCIALGTAGTSAVLTLYASVVLRPLPFPEAERLVRVWTHQRGTDERGSLSFRDYEDLRDGATTLDQLVATGRSRLMFLGEEGARRVEGEAVTSGYFELLGIRPLAGRFFAADEHVRGSEPVMVLSARTWRDRYGGDPGILGSTVPTATGTFTVVGVAPSNFRGTIEDDFPDLEFWVPLVHDQTEDERVDRSARSLWTIGRLDRGTDLAAASQQVAALGDRIARSEPQRQADVGLRVEPMGENWRADLRRRSLALLLAAGLLLLVAATNAAGLLTSRSFDRRGEMTLRAALGAGRSRLVRQIVAETLILTSAGAVLGTLAAPSLLRAFLRLAPEEVPAYLTIQLDLRALALAAGVLVVTALVAGTVPALVGSRVHPIGALNSRGATAGRRERSFGEALIVAEVAVTVVLLVGAGLLVRSYRSMDAIDLGYRTSGLLKMALFVDTVDVDRDSGLPDLYDRIRVTLAADPRVDEIALVSPTAPPATGGATTIGWAGMQQEGREEAPRVNLHRVDPHFLPTLEIPILEGRGIEAADSDEPVPVAVVSASVAGLLGGADEAVGRSVEVGGTTHRIVGVAADVRYTGSVFRRPRDLDVYASLGRDPGRVVSIVLSARAEPSELIAPSTERLHALAPRSPVDWVDPLAADVESDFQGPRFYLVLLVAFASSSLGLTAVGLFGTLAGLVAKRRSEIGIRRALGAGRAGLVRSVVLRGLTIAAIGLAFGSVGALAAAGAFRSMLYGVGGLDLPTLAVSAIVISFVAALASAIPAVAAARVSPVSALKEW